MKHITLFVMLVLSMGMFGCADHPDKEQATQEQAVKFAYTLYPTTNRWTFLKLDTSSGKIWQVHYSISDDTQGTVVPLNTEALTNDLRAGRFELIATHNIYNFILLDKVNGSTWQVQWSFDEATRLIIPIK